MFNFQFWNHKKDSTTSSAHNVSHISLNQLKKPQWICITIGVLTCLYVVGTQYFQIRRFNRKYKDNNKILVGRSKTQKVNMTWMCLYDIPKLERVVATDHSINFKSLRTSTVIDDQHKTYIACNPFISEYINLFGLISYWKWQRDELSHVTTQGETTICFNNDANNQIIEHYPQILKELEFELSSGGRIDDLIESLQSTSDFHRQIYCLGYLPSSVMTDIEINTKQLNLWRSVKEYQHDLEWVSNYMQKEVDLLPEIKNHWLLYLLIRLIY